MMSLLDKVYANNRLALLFFALLSLFFFIGLGNVHLFDWDEINFAESAREMMESGDYLRVQINYTAFWEKPPLFFWLQVVAMKVFGVGEFAARFPNAVFGFIYLTTLYFIGKRHFSAKFGMLWSLLFFASLLPHIYFKSGIIDPVFNYFIFLSIYFMLRVIGKDESSGKLAFYAGIFSGLSVLTKGPVGFLLLGLTLFVYLAIKRFKPFPSFKHILIFFSGLLLIVCSWLSIELIQNGFETMQKFIAYQLELFNSDVAGHAQPFYYHFVVVFFGCFPMSIIALPVLFKKLESPFDIHTWMKCLFWVVMILFSITTTKIIHYSSMTYIPLAFMAAMVLNQVALSNVPLRKWQNGLYLAIGLLIGILIMAVPFLIQHQELIIPYMNDPFAVDSILTSVNWSGLEPLIGLLFIIAVLFSFVFLKRARVVEAMLINASGLAITLLLVLFFVLPKIEAFTQGPAISFYQSKQSEACYVESYGFKSYAQYFYRKTPFDQRKEAKDLNWLITGEIDKPVYLVSKSTNLRLDDFVEFTLIGVEGGFRFYRRDP